MSEGVPEMIVAAEATAVELGWGDGDVAPTTEGWLKLTVAVKVTALPNTYDVAKALSSVGITCVDDLRLVPYSRSADLVRQEVDGAKAEVANFWKGYVDASASNARLVKELALASSEIQELRDELAEARQQRGWLIDELRVVTDERDHYIRLVETGEAVVDEAVRQ